MQSLADMFTDKHTQDRERGSRLLLQSLGWEGTLKHKQPKCRLWCLDAQGQEHRDLAVVPGWKPGKTFKPRLCCKLVFTTAFQQSRAERDGMFLLPPMVFSVTQRLTVEWVFSVYILTNGTSVSYFSRPSAPIPQSTLLSSTAQGCESVMEPKIFLAAKYSLW